MRAALRRLHRWCGLVVALLLLACGLTGSLLAFEHALDAWLNPGLMRTGHTRPPLPPTALLAQIEAHAPDVRVVQMPLDSPPGGSREVQVEARRAADGHQAALGFNRLFIDPATGQVLGTRQWGAWRWDRAHLMPWINHAHRTLTLPGRWGNQLLGAAAILWLGLSITGLVLTLPPRRAPFWSRWKSAWQVQRSSRGFRLIHDLHRALGLWSLPLALCTAFTGIYLNLGNEVFKPVVRQFGAITAHPMTTLPSRPTPERPWPATERLSPDAALLAAQRLLPEGTQHYTPWYMGLLEARGAYRVAFKEPGLREQAWRVRYEQVFIDAQTGQLLGRFGYQSGTAADRFLAWMYPLHSGKAWGWPGRLAIALGGLCLALLCATGLWRWAKRQTLGGQGAGRA